MRVFLAAALAALIFAACTTGGNSVPSAGSGSITMYGTIDQGVGVKK